VSDDRFEWSAAKARANLNKHGVSFEVARLVFDDPHSLDEVDHRADYGEDRSNIIGMARGRILTRCFHGAGGPVSHHLCQEGDTT
jgi:hypothetical protein